VSRYLRQYSSTLEILLIGSHLAYEIHIGPRGLTNKLVFDPGLGLPPSSVVKSEKKIRKVLKMTPDSGALANESNGFSRFDEIVSSY